MIRSKTMRRTLALIILAVPLLRAAASPNQLWDKAVETARRNAAWVPGTTLMRFDIVDDKGASTDATEVLFRISPDAAGNPVTTVERSSHNGKDTTAEQREAQEKRNREAKNGASAFTMGDNPFDPDLQDSVTAVPAAENVSIGGTACTVFRFTLKKKDGSQLEGTAALETATGAPREVKYTIKPLPAGVWSLSTVLRYGDGPVGGGFLKEAAVEGVGGILFIKKSFTSLITLDAYWKK
jgi:hypothetical protein